MVRCVLCGILLALVLSSCAFSRTMETDEIGVRTHYQNLEQTTLKAEIFAEYPDRISRYLVEYCVSGSGEDVITVLEPESIAGVSVTVREGDTTLSVADTTLATGELEELGVSPVSSLPQLLQLWKTHAIETEAIQENGILLVYETEDQLYKTVFSRDTYEPLSAEVYRDGTRFLSLQFVK